MGSFDVCSFFSCHWLFPYVVDVDVCGVVICKKIRAFEMSVDPSMQSIASSVAPQQRLSGCCIFMEE